MNYTDWYTDKMDIYRVAATVESNLTRHTRQMISEGIPCRLYRSADRPMEGVNTAAKSEQNLMLACDNSVEIKAGDEIIIYRGAMLGNNEPGMRLFASDPMKYFEPFGAVIPGLAHQQVMLHQEERNK